MSSGLIYDIGMNNGDDTAYYLYRGYRVVGVEANPLMVERVKERFRSEIAAGRLVVWNVAIADIEGELPFWVCESYSELSSFHRSIASRHDSPHYEIKVPCLRFRSIIEKHGVPDYLKIDIEGSDHFCLEDLTPSTAPAYISVEANELELLDLLHDLGYDRFKCISQFHYLPLQIPPAAEQVRYEEDPRPYAPFNRLRMLDGWEFPFGSSGPFGPDLPGRWHAFDEMKSVFAEFKTRQKNGESTPFWTEASYSFWADFHAAKAG